MTMATQNGAGLPAMLEQVVMAGDLAQLSPAERLNYYGQVCESLGLNPLTKPFQFIKLNGKLTLYASKDCTEQLARIHNISYTISDGQLIDDIYVVKAEAQKEFRMASATGAVFVGNLQGEVKANAFMKAETKACRRATLRLIGLGWLDESETDSIPGARLVDVDGDTGEIVDAAPALPQGLDFVTAEFGEWLIAKGITSDELIAVTVPEPTKRNLIAWASENGIDGYEGMCAQIYFRVAERREARNDDLENDYSPFEQEPVTAGGGEPNPSLPRRAMDE